MNPIQSPTKEKHVHVSANSGNNEWYTPSHIVTAARDVMLGIDLDPASCEIANRNVRATRYYTAEDDGLARPWNGRVWLNPPYSQPLIARFCSKLVMEFESGHISEACCITNNGTETKWGQELLAACDAVCFINKRVKFMDPSWNPSGAPLQGQMVTYFGQALYRFTRFFQPIGTILNRKQP